MCVCISMYIYIGKLSNGGGGQQTPIYYIAQNIDM